MWTLVVVVGWLGNLALLKVFSHRIKTHGGFQCLQPRPGTLVWRTPHGYIAITDHTGTHNLGNDAYAETIWEASARINADVQPCPTPTPAPAETNDGFRVSDSEDFLDQERTDAYLEAAEQRE